MANGQKITASAVLRRLRFFNQKANDLRGWSFIPKAAAEDAGFTADIEAGKLSVAKRGADAEATAALVLTLRFFLQPRDRIQIEQIAGLYEQIDVPAQDRYWVSENLKEHNSFLDGDAGIVLDGQPITNRMVLEAFVYGDLAHVNEVKRTTYLALRSGPISLFMEGLFEHVVLETMRYIFWLQAMNAETIERVEAGGEADGKEASECIDPIKP